MRKGLYAIKDMRSRQFTDPFVEVNDAAALRGFSYAINGQNAIMSFAPEDFRLFKIGEWESDLAVITYLDTGVELVAAGEDVKEKKE